MKEYDKNDDRYGHYPLTIALAEYLAKRDGVDLSSLRNYGEDVYNGTSKYEYLREAEYYTEEFNSNPEKLTPLELAEIWSILSEEEKNPKET